MDGRSGGVDGVWVEALGSRKHSNWHKRIAK